MSSEKKTSLTFRAGSAQFGWDFNPPTKEKPNPYGMFKSGIRAKAALAQPSDACKEVPAASV